VATIPLSRLTVRGGLRWPEPGVLIPAAAALLLLYLVAFPLLMLVWTSLRVFGQPGLSLANFAAVYSTARTWELLGSSLVYAAGSAALALGVGTALAWVVERTNTPGRHWFYVLSLVPLVVPGVVNTIAWIFLLSPKIGWLNAGIQAALGLPAAPFDVFTLGGMIWIEGLHLSPLVFLLMAAAFKSMDPSLEESALTSGAGTARTLVRVTLPLLLPMAASTTLIVFVRALESFETPALVGIPGRVTVLTSQIFLAVQEFPPNYGVASALSLGLLALGAVGVWWYLRLTGRSETYATVTGKAFRPRVLDLGRWRVVCAAAVGLYFVLIVGLPLFVMLWISLLPFFQAPSLQSWDRVSLQNYAFVLSYPQVQVALKNSALTAAGTATAVMAVTAVLSWITVRTRLPGRGLLDLLAFLPIAIPGLVLGVSLILQYVAFPLPIYGTLWILVLAYVIRYLPYGMRASSGSMVQIHRELEEVGATSGASWWQSFRRVTLPLLRPGLVAGWIYILVHSVRELSASMLLANSETRVLSLLMFELYQGGQFTTVAAMSVLMIVALVAIASVVHRASGRFGIRE
jgi:iron(III) transport system permease protein